MFKKFGKRTVVSNYYPYFELINLNKKSNLKYFFNIASKNQNKAFVYKNNANKIKKSIIITQRRS